MRTRSILAAAVLCAAAVVSSSAAPARADTVTLANGDKLNGTVGQIMGGKMKFTSPVLGEVTIDMNNVASFEVAGDTPAALVQPKGATPTTREALAGGTKEELRTRDGKVYRFEQLRAVNPPPQKWTGSILANVSVARGNTNTIEAGGNVNAELRRDDQFHDDRFTLNAAYRYGDTGTGEERVVTRDNWDGNFKYDRFFNDKLFGFANIKVEHDNIARLEYRLTPGVGVGYQWVETPTTNFSTEIGISYVYEKFSGQEINDFVGPRFAYHIDHKLRDNLTLFHNLEYLPAFADVGDYNLAADAGVRVGIAQGFFTEVKVEFKRDSMPAETAEKNDLRYVVGVGWAF